MAEYKTVAGPVGLKIGHKDSEADAVRQYSTIIDREVVGGWELLCIQSIPVTKDGGCLPWNKEISFNLNMLVFVKQ